MISRQLLALGKEAYESSLFYPPNKLMTHLYHHCFTSPPLWASALAVMLFNVHGELQSYISFVGFPVQFSTI